MSLRPPPGINCPGITASTFLGGSGSDGALDVATDAAGFVYVTGWTYSSNFPTSPEAFDPDRGIRHDADHPDDAWAAFVAKFDPAGSIVYSTFLGGSKSEAGYSIAADAYGNAYVTGFTISTDFPVTAGAFQQNLSWPEDPLVAGPNDAFVAKFDPQGSLVFSTYLGGSNDDVGYGIAVDPNGSVYVTGHTLSKDFPMTSNLAVYACCEADVFVTKLNPEGSAILYSTLIGGGESEVGFGIALDRLGNAYVTGVTHSGDFPTTKSGAAAGGDGDAFAAKLSAQGDALLYSTYLGGSSFDDGADIALDDGGNAYITGFTRSSDFPTTPGAFAGSSRLGGEGYVTKIDEAGDLSYSTFFGGHDNDYPWRVDVDVEGRAYVVGHTYSDDFPTTEGALDRTRNAGRDAFVTELDSTGTGLVYSTFLGGAVEKNETECPVCGDVAYSLAINSPGNVTVAGFTNSEDFPVTEGSSDTSFNGFADAFFLTLKLVPEPNRAPVAWFTTEQSQDHPDEIAVNASRSADAETVTALLEVRWDWDDDGVWDTDWSTTKVTSHKYAGPGEHTIVLEVRDPEGLTNVTRETIVLPKAPAIVSSVSADPVSGVAPLTVSFESTVSGGVSPHTSAWTFGDGGTSLDQDPVHTYETPGTFVATLVVRDKWGTESTIRISITVLAAPLSLETSFTPTTEVDTLTVSFAADANGGAPPYAYLWEFGDGATSVLEDPTHTYSDWGTYEVAVTVTDKDGRSISKSMQVVVPEPPRPPPPPVPNVALLVIVAAGVVGASSYVILRRLRLGRR